MKEININRNGEIIEVFVETTIVCSVDVSNKVINGGELYKAYDWNIDDDYFFSNSSIPIEKADQEKTNLDYLHENVYAFFSGLINRMQEEKSQINTEISLLENDLEVKVKKLQIIVDESANKGN